MNTDRINIPGEFNALYENGRIVKLYFIPLASAAGHFGPAATVVTGDETLDVEDVEGPFWRAMQDALAGDLPIEWIE